MCLRALMVGAHAHVFSCVHKCWDSRRPEVVDVSRVGVPGSRLIWILLTELSSLPEYSMLLIPEPSLQSGVIHIEWRKYI